MEGTVFIFKLLEGNQRLEAEMKDDVAGAFVEAQVFCILGEFMSILWKIMGLGNHVCSGAIKIRNTGSMGFGFVEGMYGLGNEVNH